MPSVGVNARWMPLGWAGEVVAIVHRALAVGVFVIVARLRLMPVHVGVRQAFGRLLPDVELNSVASNDTGALEGQHGDRVLGRVVNLDMEVCRDGFTETKEPFFRRDPGHANIRPETGNISRQSDRGSKQTGCRVITRFVGTQMHR